MDAGYKTPAIARMLIKDGILPVLPYTAPRKKQMLKVRYIKETLFMMNTTIATYVQKKKY